MFCRYINLKVLSFARQWDDKTGSCKRPLPPKGRGRTLMSSDFLSEEGFLRWPDRIWEPLKVGRNNIRKAFISITNI